jgi:glutamine cyclotransferase
MTGIGIRQWLATAIFLIACFLSPSLGFSAEGYRVLHTYPHDPHAFTQGLIYLGGHLYESTGLKGQSTLRMDDLDSGRVLEERTVPPEFFAEGLTNWGNTLVQLTWQAHTGFVYDRSTFKLLRTFHYAGEGWGLTQDGKQIILSDGTSSLRFLNPKTFAVERTLPVRDHGKPIDQLNELEYVHGEIYANVWMSNRIARISPATGNVLAWIDLTGLLPIVVQSSPDAVLNGIAYDAVHDRLFVTGKLWPKLFEIRTEPGK